MLVVVGVIVGLPIAIAALQLFLQVSGKRDEFALTEAACKEETVFRVGAPLQVEGLALPENYNGETKYADVRKRLLRDRFAYVEVLHPPSSMLERYHLAELGDPACEDLLASEASLFFTIRSYGEIGVPPELCIARETDTRSLAPIRFFGEKITARNGAPGYATGVQEALSGRRLYESRSFGQCSVPLDPKTRDANRLALRNAIMPARTTQYIETIAPDPKSPVRRFYANDASDWQAPTQPGPKPLPTVREVQASLVEAVDTDAKSMDRKEFGRRFRNPMQSRVGLAWSRHIMGTCLEVHLDATPRCFELPAEYDTEGGMGTGIQWVLVEGERLTSVTGTEWRAAQYRKGTPSIWLFQHDRDGNVLARMRVLLPELGFHDGAVAKPVVDFRRTDKGYRMRLQELKQDGARIAILRDVTLDIPLRSNATVGSSR